MSVTSPQLALPSGEQHHDPSVTVYGVIALGVCGVVVLGALLGAWLALSSGTAVWPPKGVKVQNYFGTTLSLTMLMAAVSAWWGTYGVVKGERRQAGFALGLAAFLLGAFVNLLTYVVQQSHLSAGASAFGAIYFALNIAMIAVAVSGVGVCLVSLVRVLGGQVTPREPQLGWAAGWYATFVAVAWFVMYTSIYVIS